MREGYTGTSQHHICTRPVKRVSRGYTLYESAYDTQVSPGGGSHLKGDELFHVQLLLCTSLGSRESLLSRLHHSVVVYGMCVCRCHCHECSEYDREHVVAWSIDHHLLLLLRIDLPSRQSKMSQQSSTDLGLRVEFDEEGHSKGGANVCGLTGTLGHCALLHANHNNAVCMCELSFE